MQAGNTTLNALCLFPPALRSVEKMAVSHIVERGETFDDTQCDNSWKWEWLSLVSSEHRLGACFRKVNIPGVAWCIPCGKHVSYASRGVASLTTHMSTNKHQKSWTDMKNNQRLPGKLEFYVELGDGEGRGGGCVALRFYLYYTDFVRSK